MKEQDLTPSHENESKEKIELPKDISHEQPEAKPTEPDLTPEENVEIIDKEKLQEKPNYASLEKHELIQQLKIILESELNYESRERAESIKIHFYKKHNAKIEVIKRKFIEDGGLESDFKPNKDEEEIEIKGLLQEFRDKKAEIARSLEIKKENNLKEKLLIIDEIKQLINCQESFEKTFNDFRKLEKRWKNCGMVPSQSIKHLWENYHHAVENFYDYIKINRDLRDMDLRRNYEDKIKLCEMAEKLFEEPSAIKAFNNLQKLHEVWRETGPVERDKRDELWDRFRAASNTINRNQQNFYNIIREEQIENLKQKTALCQKVEEISDKAIDFHKDWNLASKEIIDIQQKWRTIGFAPKKDNNQIYQRFRTACDLFFNHKRDFYLEHKDQLNDNLKLKIELCEKAEILKDNTDWKKTTNELIRIQKKWKMIGAIPRKVSNELWDRFRLACDSFFDKKADHFKNLDSKQVENLELKEALIEQVYALEISDNNDTNLDAIKQFQKEWLKLGHVPLKIKEKIQNNFRKAINSVYDKMNLDSSNLEVQKFRLKIDTILDGKKSEDKLIIERSKIFNKIKQLENDIALWENNMGFFSLSDSSSSILKEMQGKINQGKKNLALLNDKINIIDDLT